MPSCQYVVEPPTDHDLRRRSGQEDGAEAPHALRRREGKRRAGRPRATLEDLHRIVDPYKNELSVRPWQVSFLRNFTRRRLA